LRDGCRKIKNILFVKEKNWKFCSKGGREWRETIQNVKKKIIRIFVPRIKKKWNEAGWKSHQILRMQTNDSFNLEYND
jgi:hypothetical protein